MGSLHQKDYAILHKTEVKREDTMSPMIHSASRSRNILFANYYVSCK